MWYRRMFHVYSLCYFFLCCECFAIAKKIDDSFVKLEACSETLEKLRGVIENKQRGMLSNSVVLVPLSRGSEEQAQTAA